MSDIEENLQKILNSVYGKDVRQAIHDSIHDCYEDGKTGATDLLARERISQIVSSSNASLNGYAVETKEFGLSDQQSLATGDYTYTGSTSFSEDVIIIDVVAFNHVGQTGVPISYRLSNKVLTATATVPYTVTGSLPVMAVYLVQRPIKITELSDIRIGEDGTEYPTAGDAVREQISDLKSQITQLEAIPTAVKRAMDTLFTKMAVIDGDGYEGEVSTIHAWATAVNVVSITAVFEAGDVEFTTATPLDDLRQYLTITANYDDSTSAVVRDYTLSGTLTDGVSVVTVTYLNKTTTFNVNVTSWSLVWDYTYGALPSDEEWTVAEGQGGTHTTVFEEGKGIKWTGTGWSLGYTPVAHPTTTVGVMECVCNFEQFAANGSIRATLSTSADCIIALLTPDGVRVNSGTGTLIENTAPVLNTDYTLRVERTATEGKIYLDGTLIYTGELRALAGTNNVLIAKTALSGTMTVYIKAMRFLHVS